MLRHLDSNILVAHLRGNPKVTSLLKKHKPDLAMSVIVYCELVYGAKNSTATDSLKVLDDLLKFVPVVSLDAACAAEYSRIRLDLRTKGPIGDMDLLIAATALTHKATLVRTI